MLTRCDPSLHGIIVIVSSSLRTVLREISIRHTVALEGTCPLPESFRNIHHKGRERLGDSREVCENPNEHKHHNEDADVTGIGDKRRNRPSRRHGV